jgi:CopG family nickel-responsive transcriptional regulator
MELERISLSIEKGLLARFDRLLRERRLGNRSEAVRDLMRRRLVEDQEDAGQAPVVASLTLVYEHEQRALSERLVEAGHHRHAHVLSTMHVHLDPHMCLEVMALRGKPAELRRFADHLIGLKGVQHGRLVSSSAAWRPARRERH